MLKWQQIMGVIYYQALMITSLLKMCTFTAQIPFTRLTWPGVGGVIKIYQSTQPQHEVFSAIPLLSLNNLTSLFTCNFGFKISPNYHLKLQKESNYLSIIPFHLVNRENVIFCGFTVKVKLVTSTHQNGKGWAYR